MRRSQKIWTALLVVGLMVASVDLAHADQKSAQTDVATPHTNAAMLDQYLTRLVPFGFSGVVLVAKDDKVLLSKGYGLANRETHTPFVPKTIVNLGSITKQFTAVAILKLESQGKLSVNDPISKYLPGVTPDKTEITLHHLLTHTAGLRSDYGDSDYEKVDRDEYIARVMAEPLESKPGERFEYANSGYSLLAAIVEIVSGESYEQYLSKNVLAPAGMSQTGYRLPRWDASTVAHGYIEGKDWGTVVDKPMADDGPYWNLRGNGGLQTTAEDMLKWHKALETDAVLPASSRERMFTPYVAEGPEGRSHYGYGWAIFKTRRNTKLVAHNGGNGIFVADFLRFVDEGLMVFVASNSAEFPAISLSPALARIVFGDHVDMPGAAVASTAKQTDGLVGSYTLGGASVSVESVDGKFVVKPQGQDAIATLWPSHEDPADLAAFGVRSRMLFTKSREGDYKPLAEAFGGRMSVDQIKENESSLWGDLEKEFGAFKEISVIGTAPTSDGDYFTWVEFQFERGRQMMRLRWGPRFLLGIRPVQQGPQRLFLATEGGGFTAFDVPTASVITMTANRAANGAVEALTISVAGKTVVARRGRPVDGSTK